MFAKLVAVHVFVSFTARANVTLSNEMLQILPRWLSRELLGRLWGGSGEDLAKFREDRGKICGGSKEDLSGEKLQDLGRISGEITRSGGFGKDTGGISGAPGENLGRIWGGSGENLRRTLGGIGGEPG